jgi:hypothetical protein
MMVLRIGDKCELILIFKKVGVTLAVGALEVQATFFLNFLNNRQYGPQGCNFVV